MTQIREWQFWKPKRRKEKRLFQEIWSHSRGIFSHTHLLASNPETLRKWKTQPEHVQKYSSILPPSAGQAHLSLGWNKDKVSSSALYFLLPTLQELNIAISSAHRLGNDWTIFRIIHLRNEKEPASDGTRMCVAWLTELTSPGDVERHSGCRQLKVPGPSLPSADSMRVTRKDHKGRARPCTGPEESGRC